MKNLLILLFLCVGVRCFGAAGDIVSCAIRSDGWSADLVIAGMNTGGTYDWGLSTNNGSVAAKVVLSVTSQGFNTSGTAITSIRKIVGTQAVRKAYPNNASIDETLSNPTYSLGNVTIRIALDDYVYSGDSNIVVNVAASVYTASSLANNATTALSVSNGSTIAYPRAIGHFAIEQRRPVDGSHDIEVFAVQKYGTQGKPLAKVLVYAVGGTSGKTVSGSATVMTKSKRADALPVYVVNLDLSIASGFTRGETITIDFTAYPWIGDAAATLNSTTNIGATIYNLGPLKWTAMTKMIARVSASGNDSTGVASTSQATADASPCLTISGALTKIAAQNNTSYTLNRCDGGEVQCNAGTYKVGKYAAQASTAGYFTITPHSTATKATVIFDGYVTSQFQYAYQRYLNVTFTRAASGYIVFANNPNVLVMEGVDFNDSFSASSWYSGGTGTDVEFLDCTSNNTRLSPGGNDGHSRLNRSTTFTSPAGSTALCGNPSFVFGMRGTGGSGNIWASLTGAAEANTIIAFCHYLSKPDGYFILSGEPLSGLAVIGNVIERTSAAVTPLSEISNGNIGNLIFWHNTYAGQRFNHENDIASPYVNITFTNWTAKFNSFNARGDHRADIRDTDSTMIGTWSVGYSAGWAGNMVEGIAYPGDMDFWGLNCNTPIYPLASFSSTFPAGYILDASRGGTDAGGGNYRLKSSAYSISQNIVNDWMMPFDIEGNARGEIDPPGAFASAVPRKGFFAQ